LSSGICAFFKKSVKNNLPFPGKTLVIRKNICLEKHAIVPVGAEQSCSRTQNLKLKNNRERTQIHHIHPAVGHAGQFELKFKKCFVVRQ